MTSELHVAGQLFDYLEERVAPAERVAIETHLARCAECAAVYETGRALRADVARHGARHLAPERLVAIAEAEAEARGRPGAAAAASPASAEEHAHLATCARCREELGWLRDLPALPQAAGDIAAGAAAPGRPEKPRRARVIPITRAWGWGAAGLAAAATLLVTLVAREPSVDPRIAALAHIAPLAVEETRGGAPDDPYARGFHNYVIRDWPGAAAALREATAADPAREDASLLLGSALLLAGDHQAAAKELERAIAVARDPAVAEEARWQLANARLAAGDAGRAEVELRALAGAGGRRAAVAEELLDRIRSR